jgi:hypothetical protein
MPCKQHEVLNITKLESEEISTELVKHGQVEHTDPEQRSFHRTVLRRVSSIAGSSTKFMFGNASNREATSRLTAFNVETISKAKVMSTYSFRTGK